MVSTMPSRMTTISNCSFMSERCDRSKNGLLMLISWQMVSGDTKKSWSAPVPKPTSSSHWSKGKNSPSGVCRDWKHNDLEILHFHFYLWAIILTYTVCQYHEFSGIIGTVWHYGKNAYLLSASLSVKKINEEIKNKCILKEYFDI